MKPCLPQKQLYKFSNIVQKKKTKNHTMSESPKGAWLMNIRSKNGIVACLSQNKCLPQYLNTYVYTEIHVPW
jgi:hypothetical protein